jgi:hypothetical protein
MCYSPWSRVATPSLNPNGSTMWLGDTSTGYNPYVMLSSGRYEVGQRVRTFVSCHVQSLRQWEMTMGMRPGPRCPSCSFSAELDGTEINTRIQGILVHGADQNSGPAQSL